MTPETHESNRRPSDLTAAAVVSDRGMNLLDLAGTDRNLGKLEIVDDMNSRRAIDKMPETLNRTETMILSNLQDAIRSVSVDRVQDMLKTLAENPHSADRVLQALKSQMEDKQTQVNWVRGADNQGNSIIRLDMKYTSPYPAQTADGRIVNCGTDLSIGTDGRNSATEINKERPEGVPVNPQDALHLFAPTSKKEQTSEDALVTGVSFGRDGK